MKKKNEIFKKLSIIIVLSTMLVLFYYGFVNYNDIKDESTKEYYVKNTFEETGSRNFVTGIYLDYRLFDSVFEGALLLITATGIVYIAKKNTDS